MFTLETNLSFNNIKEFRIRVLIRIYNIIGFQYPFIPTEDTK